jgi:hypothetical protein
MAERYAVTEEIQCVQIFNCEEQIRFKIAKDSDAPRHAAEFQEYRIAKMNFEARYIPKYEILVLKYDAEGFKLRDFTIGKMVKVVQSTRTNADTRVKVPKDTRSSIFMPTLTGATVRATEEYHSWLELVTLEAQTFCQELVDQMTVSEVLNS